MILNKEMDNTFGGRLKYLMDKKGLTANRLAVIMGIHASTIANYISNSTDPHPKKLDLLSEHLGVNVDWLKNGVGVAEKKLSSDKATENGDLYKKTEVNFQEALHVLDKVENSHNKSDLELVREFMSGLIFEVEKARARENSLRDYIKNM